MYRKLKLAIVTLAFAAAGCAGNPAASAFAGGTLPPVKAADASPIYTLSGGYVTSTGGVPVTARDWNCPRCYK